MTLETPEAYVTFDIKVEGLDEQRRFLPVAILDNTELSISFKYLSLTFSELFGNERNIWV